MKVLVVGKGGREHALVWKLAQSPLAETVFCAPGNAGTAKDGTNVDIDVRDFDTLVRFAKREKIDLTVVGPEEPLANGLVDLFQKEGLRVFGPTKAAAQLEARKVFAKQVMLDANVPTAEFRAFDHPAAAKSYIETREYPVVVKADGLAAGKGVIVCSTPKEAMAAVDRIMVREEFGLEVGRSVVVEKRLQGEEVSLLALVGGRTIIPMEPTQDHKQIFDGDQGPNTGGMGAYCPAPILTPQLLNVADSRILVATVHAMKRRRTPFQGVLYAGIMVTNQGPRVLEFNCRFGDPEIQPLLMRLQTDLLPLLQAIAESRLDEWEGQTLEWDLRPAVCVVMASGGYPGKYEKDKVISGLDEVAGWPDVKVFHAGTRLDGNLVYTDGGRVLGVTALGDTLSDSNARAYEGVEAIRFSGAYYRTDIADKALGIIKEVETENKAQKKEDN
ncbi:MAG: phosphoribosylamine--glycine ligase [Gemmataceae bacterium]